MINELVKKIPNPNEGFRMIWSAVPFPSHTHSINRINREAGGVWYKMEQDPQLKGWLCPALFKYMSFAPEKIYLKANPL